MSASTKYSKYSSRIKKGRTAAKYSVFQSKMRKVVASVDKRKKFNNTMVPASLGIQSIVYRTRVQRRGGREVHF